MFRIDGKTALVTGASGGIGAAIARTLHAQGGTVVLSGTRRDALDALAAELGGRAHVCPADLRDPAAADTLVAAAEAAAGPLAILVNNAGLTRDMLALRMKDEDWQTVLDVDLGAPFRLARATLKGMLRRRAGRIVSIGSIVGATGNADHPTRIDHSDLRGNLPDASRRRGNQHGFSRLECADIAYTEISGQRRGAERAHPILQRPYRKIEFLGIPSV